MKSKSPAKKLDILDALHNISATWAESYLVELENPLMVDFY